MVANIPSNSAEQQIFARGDWREQLAQLSDDSAERLRIAYERTLPRIQSDLDALTAQIRAFTDKPTAQDIRGLTTFARLQRTIEAEMNDFARIMANEGAVTQTQAITLALNAALDMTINSAGGAGSLVAQAWNRPDSAAIQALIGYVDDPAFRNIVSAFGTAAAEDAADVILALVAQGKNPLYIARRMNDWLLTPYAWSENSVRTLQLWSYRRGVHAGYTANGDIVEGWVWWASRDLRTCISCWEQHGTQHPNTEILNDHHRGRCTPLPVVIGSTWANEIPTGQELFNDLSQADQIAIMGSAMWRAWQAGEVAFGDFSTPYEHDVFGEMLHAASLKGILGEKAVRYYFGNQDS